MQVSNRIAVVALLITALSAGYALARGGGIETQRITSVENELVGINDKLSKHDRYHSIIDSLSTAALVQEKSLSELEDSFTALNRRQGSEETRSSVRDERIAVLIEGFTVSQNKLASAIDNQSGILARLSNDMGRLDERLKTLEK